MNKIGVIIFCLGLFSCSQSKKMLMPERNESAITGTEFYKKAVAFHWHQRDSFAVKEILAGNIPSFLKDLVAVHTSIKDSSGKNIYAVYFVTPDYVCIGSNEDWARKPLSPMAAQQIADSFHCFCPQERWYMIFIRQPK